MFPKPVMAVFEIPNEYGYAILVAVAFWVQQSVLFVIPIAMQRSQTGIKAPYLYPTDKLVKDLSLSEAQVECYMCAQRVHQQNVEFLTIFFPIFFLGTLANPIHAAAAGALVWVGRMITAIGYWKGAGHRIYGAW